MTISLSLGKLSPWRRRSGSKLPFSRDRKGGKQWQKVFSLGMQLEGEESEEEDVFYLLTL